MRIIVGLGNPGNAYTGTRHNVGFETVNLLARVNGISIKKAKHRSLIGEGKVAGQRVLLVKPQTYMNLSGEAVQAILWFYGTPPSGMVVVYDDVNLPVGDIRVREKGSAGGHNGVKDIIRCLGTDDFPRVRIGIGAKPATWDLADYVLGRFCAEEQPIIVGSVQRAADAVTAMLAEGITQSMEKFNARTKPVNPSDPSSVRGPVDIGDESAGSVNTGGDGE